MDQMGNRVSCSCVSQQQQAVGPLAQLVFVLNKTEAQMRAQQVISELALHRDMRPPRGKQVKAQQPVVGHPARSKTAPASTDWIEGGREPSLGPL